MEAARQILQTRDAAKINQYFRQLYIDGVEHVRPGDIEEIHAASVRLAALPDPAAAAFSGWLLLTLAKRMEDANVAQ